MDNSFDMFLVCAPGLEQHLAAEARDLKFAGVKQQPGGVEITGGWAEMWRANLALRGAVRVLLRLGGFRAMHMAQLDKRARKFPWGDILRADVPVKVEATCKTSRIYHHKGAAERVARAITEELGAPISDQATLRVMVRIEDDFCSFSIDTTGDPLHKRGHKLAVNKAPMRENLAAMFLRASGYIGTEPVYDPMCGSGTFPIEAAEIAAGLQPGRSRSFAFEALSSYDADAVSAMVQRDVAHSDLGFYGSDRDAGAVTMSQANAERAGVDHLCKFHHGAISAATPPCDQPGLVMINPPYGGRIGNKGMLFGLHKALGDRLMSEFSGWRVGIITNDGGLAKTTGLPFLPTAAPVSHGGIKVKLYQTGPLK
jgi:putative N6-adenine-specific DNA methylase